MRESSWIEFSSLRSAASAITSSNRNVYASVTGFVSQGFFKNLVASSEIALVLLYLGLKITTTESNITYTVVVRRSNDAMNKHSYISAECKYTVSWPYR